MDNVLKEEQIARITILARVEFLPAVISFVRDISTELGLTGRAIERLELVVEEACINVIEHAFNPDEETQAPMVLKGNEQEPAAEQKIDNLYKEIGRIQVENAWLKKKLGF